MKTYLTLFSTLGLALACAGAAEEPAPAPQPAVTAPTPDPSPRDDAAEAEKSWMVIVATTQTEAKAEAVLQTARDDDLPGYYRAYDTDEVPGLKPGLFVVSVALTSDQDSAQRIAQAFGTLFEGTYFREVGMVPQDWIRPCAGERPDHTCLVGDGVWRAVVILDPVDGAGSDDWLASVYKTQANFKTSGVAVTRTSQADSVEIVHGGQQVHTLDLSPYARPGFVLLQQGMNPEYVSFDKNVELEAERLFGMSIVDMGDLY